MMGLILQVVEETVVEVGGEDLWDVMTERAGVEGIYSRLDSYPMSEFLALLDALAAELSLSVDETMAVAGERAFPHLYSRWPEDQRHYEDPISLIEALNQVIHSEVRGWTENANPPLFSIYSDGSDHIIRYDSARGLVQLCRGLIKGVFAWFDWDCEVVVESVDQEGAEFRVFRSS